MNQPERTPSPYEPPATFEPPTPGKRASSETSAINVDPVDNILQAVWILVSTGLGGIIGGVASAMVGIFNGACLGLLFGLLSSGIFLMFYHSES